MTFLIFQNSYSIIIQNRRYFQSKYNFHITHEYQTPTLWTLYWIWMRFTGREEENSCMINSSRFLADKTRLWQTFSNKKYDWHFVLWKIQILFFNMGSIFLIHSQRVIYTADFFFQSKMIWVIIWNDNNTILFIQMK